MDDLRKQSDKELKKIEDDIERIYKDAEVDLKDKWDKYMSRAEKRVESAEKALQDAMKTGDADAISAAKAALTQKKQAVFLRDKQFSEMVDAVTDRMANVNQLAADYVNGQMPRMYSYNYNGSLREVQKDADAAGISGIAFNMIDDATVERMQKRGEVTLPKRKIDVPKDKQWNRKAINAQIMQGIIQGESIPQMSKRLREVTDMNKNSSIRNARTLTTEAENGGRLDSMKTASDLGLEYEKTWIATHDERTRLSHALIDGESVPLDEKFSNGLQYPADPSGPPEEVYNCRCSLVRKLIGYKGHAIDDIGSYEPTYFDDVKAEAAASKPSEDELHETAEAFAEEQARFTPATTREEAVDYLQTVFYEVTPSTRVIQEELLVENANQIQALNAKFGVIPTDNVGSFTASKYRGRHGASVIAYGGATPRIDGSIDVQIGLVGDKYSNKEALIERTLKERESGWNMPFADENASVYTVTHEYGHILEHMTIIDRKGLSELYTRGDKTYEEWRHDKFLTEQGFKDGTREIWKEIIGIAKEENPDFKLSENLSRYGQTNVEEAFAETFANSQLGKPNELGRAMQKWLEKEGF